MNGNNSTNSNDIQNITNKSKVNINNNSNKIVNNRSKSLYVRI